jgi:hypothetical protein
LYTNACRLGLSAFAYKALESILKREALALSLITLDFAVLYLVLALAQELDINILEIKAIQVAIMH